MNEAKEFAHWIIKNTQEVVTIGACRRYCGKVLNLDELYAIWYPKYIEKQICQDIREWFPELWNDKTDGSHKSMQVFKDGDLAFPNQEKSLDLYHNVLKVKNLLPNKSYVRRSLYKVMCMSGDYKKLRKAIEKASQFTIFSENEKDFHTQLVKIYQKEFKVN